MIEYEVEKRIAVLSEYGSSTKEVTRTSWNRQPAKFDIRIWRSNGTPTKGITLTDDEMKALILEVLPDLISR